MIDFTTLERGTLIVHVKNKQFGVFTRFEDDKVWAKWSGGDRWYGSIETYYSGINNQNCIRLATYDDITDFDNIPDFYKKPRKFKKGDKVRIIKRLPDNKTGGHGCFDPNNRVGVIAHISKVYNSDYQVCKNTDGSSDHCGRFIEEELEIVDEKSKVGDIFVGDPKITNPLTNSIMSNIISFAKNMTLSKEEKLLRKHGLKDECGSYSNSAEAIVMAKLCADNEDYLVEIATKMEAENKK